MSEQGVLLSCRPHEAARRNPFAWRWLAYGIIIALYQLGWSGVFPLDDAYITLHNARALIAGNDPVYGVHPLIGATSLVDLMLVAVLGLVLPLTIASLVVGACSTAAYAFALDVAVRRAGASKWQTASLVLSGLTIGTVWTNLNNGLETGLAMAAVAGMLALRDDKRWLPVLAGVSPFIRPELGVLAAILVLRLSAAQEGYHKVRLPLVAVVAAMPFLGWLWFCTGYVLPTTVGAKLAFFAEYRWTGQQRAGALVWAIAVCGIAPALFGLASVTKRGWAEALFAGGIIATAIALTPGALGWNYGRYLMPVVPALLVGVAMLDQGKVRAIAIAIIALWSVAWSPYNYRVLQQDRKYTLTQLAWLESLGARLPPGTHVLIHDAGMIAWVAPHLRLYDLVGLKTPRSIAFHRRFTRRSCGWSAALDAMAREYRTEYLVDLQTEYWRCIADDLRAAGWKLDPQLPDDARYQLYKLTPP